MEDELTTTLTRNGDLEHHHEKNCETLSKLHKQLQTILGSLEHYDDPENKLRVLTLSALFRSVSSRLDDMSGQDMIPYPPRGK
jgi:hypothetical protein